ncbi:hypothetical protein AAH678_31055, partial [Sodalis endosymbiont of Spalangia cameroni]
MHFLGTRNQILSTVKSIAGRNLSRRSFFIFIKINALNYSTTPLLMISQGMRKNEKNCLSWEHWG